MPRRAHLRVCSDNTHVVESSSTQKLISWPLLSHLSNLFIIPPILVSDYFLVAFFWKNFPFICRIRAGLPSLSCYFGARGGDRCAALISCSCFGHCIIVRASCSLCIKSQVAHRAFQSFASGARSSCHRFASSAEHCIGGKSDLPNLHSYSSSSPFGVLAQIISARPKCIHLESDHVAAGPVLCC